MEQALKLCVTTGDVVGHATVGSAGIDLKVSKGGVVESDKVTLFGTGVHAEIPKGYFGMVVVRSSMGVKGLNLANQVGIIDSDYRGEIKLPLISKLGSLELQKGERVAQMIILPHWMSSIQMVNSLNDLEGSERGTGGFGSTGVK